MSISDQSEIDFIVVGDGIASWGVLLALSKKFPNKKIVQISVDKALKPCTLNSTATVSLNGIQKGISPLGDLLYNSYFFTKNLIESWNCPTIEKTNHYHFGDVKKLQDRFHLLEVLQHEALESEEIGKKTEAFLFDPLNFKNWFKDNILTKFNNFSFESEYITGFNENDNLVHINTLSKNNMSCKRLIFCTGAYERYQFGGKKVTGHYLSWKYKDFEESFIISLKGNNLIFNKQMNTLMLGGTSNRDEVSLIDIYSLNKMREEFNNILRTSLPSVESATIHSGHRQKGKKRTPYWGLVSDYQRVYSVSSLYKNGYTLAWYIGNNLVDTLD